MTNRDLGINRRQYVQAVGAVGATGMIAGCLGGGSNNATTKGNGGSGNTATSTNSDESGGSSGTTLTITWPGGINNMHPLGWLTIPDFDTVRMMYEPLVSVNDKAQAIGQLAKSWDVSGDGKSFTWHLQENVTWQDGKPFTADDVAYTFRLMKENSWPYLGSLSEVLGNPNNYEIKDKHTLVTPLTKPYAALPLVLADLGLIVPKHIWKGIDKPTKYDNTKSPVGSGPFVFKERKEHQYLKFSLNKDYWGTKPNYDQVVIKIIPTTSDQILSLKKGDTGLLQLTPGPEIDSVKKANAVQTTKAGSTYIRYIFFNTTKKPFDDVNVRHAIAYAINRNQLVKLVMGGYAEPATSVIASGLQFYQNSDVPAYDYDVKKAKQLLDSNGYKMQGNTRMTPDGEKMEYKFPISNTGNWPRFADLIKQQLSKIGISLDIKSLQSNSYTNQVTVNHKFKLSISEWRLWFDPDPFLSPSFEQKGSLNFSEYHNSTFNEYMQKQRAATDKNQRQKYLYKAQEIIAKDLPWYTLMYPNLLFGYNSSWSNPDPIPRYGMQSAYGHKPGTGPLLEFSHK